MQHIKQTGQALIELLVTIGIMAIILPALLTGIVASRQGKAQEQIRLQAVGILQETEEAVRSVRENGWVAFAVDGTYYPTLSGSQWVLTACPVVGGVTTCPTDSNGFTRQVVIGDVYRNNFTNIVSTPGTLDPSTKQIDTTVSWKLPYSSSVTATTYLTRYLDNLTHEDTTLSDFNAGTYGNTDGTSTSGGEVILGAGGGGGDWCIPSKSITQVDLPKSGVANAVMAIEGSVFAGTGDNASGVSFQKIGLTTAQDPPVATPAATFDGYKTNAVFGEQNYAYLATDTNSAEFVIIDLTQYSDPPTNSKYKQLGTIDAPGNGSGNSIFVVNNKAYVTAGSKFYIYDLTTRAGSHTTPMNSSGLTLNGTGMKVVVVGNNAYVATSATTNQLQIIDISNPSSPTITGSISVNGAAGRDLFINSANKRAYLVTAASATQPEFFILDIDSTSPTYKQVKGSYDAGGTDPKGVTVVTGNRAILVGTGGTNQYQVINIANESSPTQCAGVQYSTGVYGVSSVLQSNGYAYSYIITGDANAELKIILGGAGGEYSSAGTYTSAPFDAASVGLAQTAFNRYTATFLQPPQTTIGFQVAVANAVSNSCTGASYTFIGPNKTSSLSDLFTTSTAAIPLWSSGSYQNPGRCFEYKVYFTSSDPTQTPELDDFTINYSP